MLVIGSGPAGLAAARAAAKSGARVILCEEDFRLGGTLLTERHDIDGAPARDFVETVEAELEALPECRILRRTTVQGVYDGGTYAALERVNDHVAQPPAHEPRQRLWRIVAKRAVVCAGAIERPIVFGDNDRPGIMLAGAVRAYVNRYGVAPGRRAVVFADNDDAFRTVADLAQAGIEVAAVVDGRRTASRAAQEAAEAAGARYFANAAIERVRGRHGVKGVEIRDASGGRESFACDLIAVSGGWNPALHLTTHLNGKPQWNESLAALVPGDLAARIKCRRRGQGHLRARSVPRRGRRGRSQSSVRMRLRRFALARSRCRARNRRDDPGVAGREEQGQGLRRFPE